MIDSNDKESRPHTVDGFLFFGVCHTDLSTCPGFHL